MHELKPGMVVKVVGIYLRHGETCTLIEPSTRKLDWWYVRLRNGGIAMYPGSDLEPVQGAKCR